MIKETGGSAFPYVVNDEDKITWEEGMTLRDYFAAKAMQAEVNRGGYYQAGKNMDVIAKTAYKMADAMLEARK